MEDFVGMPERLAGFGVNVSNATVPKMLQGREERVVQRGVWTGLGCFVTLSLGGWSDGRTD